MAEDRIEGASNVSRIHNAQIAAQQKERMFDARADSAKASFLEFCEESVFNPGLMQSRFKKLEDRLKHKASAESEKSEGESSPKQTTKAGEIAARFAKQNGELSTRGLQTLLAQITPNLSEDEMLEIVLKFYPDPSNADEAIDYLIEASQTKAREVRKEIKQKLITAKEKYNANFGREIKAGKNIRAEANLFSEKGLGSRTALRDLYRDITGNPREPIDLFEELTNNFEYDQMRTLIDFFLGSLGADMKSKGPSIDLNELKRLLVETRKLQAILSVYNFFEERVDVIKRRFQRAGLPFPKNLTFLILAKVLMAYVKDRFPSRERVRKMAPPLYIHNQTAAQIIIFTQYRDAMRNIAPKLFKSERHRNDLLYTLLDTLSDLEDKLEEEEEEENEET